MKNNETLKYKEIQQRVINAIVALYQRDRNLLNIDANERSINSKLAAYLQREFPGWNVDCEYNRLGSDVKRLPADLGQRRKHFSGEDQKAGRVYPDIIIHKRGSRENLVVIEVKKGEGDERSLKRDLDKLRDFTDDTDDAAYKYTLGLLLILNSVKVRVVQRGTEQSAESKQWTEKLKANLKELGDER